MQQLAKTFAIGLVALWAFALFGCSRFDIKESSTDSGRSLVPTPILSTPSPELHDIAVTAVDFDPLPRPDKPLDAEKSSLLAIIENKGNKAETKITISVTLRTDKEEKLLFQSSAEIEKLAPGESKVVRFEKLGSIPPMPIYVLNVLASPVGGEVQVDNNSKSYRIEVVMTSH